MNFSLNWREIERLAARIAPEIEGLFADRVVVPERPESPEGFFKGEWALRLHSRTRDATFLFSARPRKPYFGLLPGKGPKASLSGTRSGFDLSLNKHLAGLKLVRCEAVSRERTLILWFEKNAGGSEGHLGLVLSLIPALPEALLIETDRLPGPVNAGESFPILARSRNQPLDGGYARPDGAQSPDSLTVREEIASDLETYSARLRSELARESFDLRVQRAHSKLNAELKYAATRLKQNETALREAEREADFQKYGDLLKGMLGNPPPLVGKIRKLMDWETGHEIDVPCDSKLSPKEQVERFYSLAKRKTRRVAEARLRIEGLQQKKTKFEREILGLKALAASSDLPAALKELSVLEGQLGLGSQAQAKEEKKASFGWDGKTFFSREGLPILVGRSKDENLELTFKFARGNDLWMHVRGRPGAHVVIPLRSKKSASLETLLDAACLCVFYSGGEHQGKTEVDYTQKKHVKRIKDSTEASYTHNKTLIVEVARERLDRLMASADV